MVAAAMDGVELIAFELGGRRHALLASAVRELFPALRVVPLPNAPAIVDGVINIRGALVPVLDIRARFGLPAKALELSDHFVVAHAGDRAVALRVDRATDMLRIDRRLIVDARTAVPETLHVSGVALLPDGLVVIHDLAAFLSQPEQAQLERALADAET